MNDKYEEKLKEFDKIVSSELSDADLDMVTGGTGSSGMYSVNEYGQTTTPAFGFCRNFDWNDTRGPVGYRTKYCYLCKYWDLEQSIANGTNTAACKNPLK